MTARWGILGTGWVAQMFCDDLALQRMDIAAIGSRSEDSARAFAAKYGNPRAHGSYQALVDDPDVDLIYVATPHPFHVEHAELALKAGKNVLVEKPFTINAAEARHLVDLAAERGLTVMEAMWTRYLPHIARIDEIIANGTIGEVHALIVDHTQQLSADPQHRVNNLDLGGGALLDLGIYPIWYADHLFGAPDTIGVSTIWNEQTGVDRQDTITFGYGTGRHASIVTACDIQGPNRATIIGTEGRIDLAETWYNPTVVTVYDTAGRVVERHEQRVDGRGMQYQAWAAERAIADEGEIIGARSGGIMTGARSVQVMHTMDAIRREIGLTYPMESAPGIPR